MQDHKFPIYDKIDVEELIAKLNKIFNYLQTKSKKGDLIDGKELNDPRPNRN